MYEKMCQSAQLWNS